MNARVRSLPPQAVRALGVELNGGRLHGWVDNLSEKIGTPPATIRGWAQPVTAKAHRPITGAAATMLMLLVLMQRRDVPVAALMEAVAAEAARWLGEDIGNNVVNNGQRDGRA